MTRAESITPAQHRRRLRRMSNAARVVERPGVGEDPFGPDRARKRAVRNKAKAARRARR